MQPQGQREQRETRLFLVIIKAKSIRPAPRRDREPPVAGGDGAAVSPAPQLNQPKQISGW